jgi:hypothetical protein
VKIAIEMGSSAMIHVPSFIKIGSGIRKLWGGGGGGGKLTNTARLKKKPNFILFFKNMESRPI